MLTNFDVRIDLRIRVDNSTAEQAAEQFLDNVQTTYSFQLRYSNHMQGNSYMLQSEYSKLRVQKGTATNIDQYGLNDLPSISAVIALLCYVSCQELQTSC